MDEKRFASIVEKRNINDEDIQIESFNKSALKSWTRKSEPHWQLQGTMDHAGCPVKSLHSVNGLNNTPLYYM